jgi:hypothetical protein
MSPHLANLATTALFIAILSSGLAVIEEASAIAIPEWPTGIPKTCGTELHPALAVAIVPGQTENNVAVFYQFQGIPHGGVYMSWRMATISATNEFDNFAIVARAYDGANEVGLGSSAISGNCHYLGQMPTSAWLYDVLGGGGGFTNSSSCTAEEWWEWSVGGSISADVGAGFTILGGGATFEAKKSWGESHSCSSGGDYDSGKLINAKANRAGGPCLECYIETRASSSSNAGLVPGYQDCVGQVLMPVTGKHVAQGGSTWQLWQEYNPVNDFTNTFVFWENHDTSINEHFSVVQRSGSTNWPGATIATTIASGCHVAAAALFGNFAYEILVSRGSGECRQDGTQWSGNMNHPLLDTTRIHVSSGTGDGSHSAALGHTDSADCGTDTYSTEKTLYVAGLADVCVPCLLEN